MALAKAEIEFDSSNKISKLTLNDVDFSDSLIDKKVVVEEGSQRILKIKLACDSISIKNKEDS